MWRLLKRWVVDGCAARPCGCNSQRRGRPEVITLKTTRPSSRSLDESWHSPKKLHSPRREENRKMNSNREEYISNVSTEPLFPPFGRQVECLLLQLAGRPINRPTFLNEQQEEEDDWRLNNSKYAPDHLFEPIVRFFPIRNRPPLEQATARWKHSSLPILGSFHLFSVCLALMIFVPVRRGVYPQIRPPGGQVSPALTCSPAGLVGRYLAK
jgi:hypothetical protein